MRGWTPHTRWEGSGLGPHTETRPGRPGVGGGGTPAALTPWRVKKIHKTSIAVTSTRNTGSPQRRGPPWTGTCSPLLRYEATQVRQCTHPRLPHRQTGRVVRSPAPYTRHLTKRFPCALGSILVWDRVPRCGSLETDTDNLRRGAHWTSDRDPLDPRPLTVQSFPKGVGTVVMVGGNSHRLSSLH